MNLILFESDNIEGLLPFSFNHSPLELRVGAFTNLQRIERLYQDRKIIVIVRDNLRDVIQDRFPDLLINPDTVPKGICLNSSAIFENEHLDLIEKNDALSNNSELISFKLEKDLTLMEFRDSINTKKGITVSCDVPIIRNIWDIFQYPKMKLFSDFNDFLFNNNYIYHPSLITINEESIYIGKDVKINAGVIIDASKGPVIIEKETHIDHGVVIEGPN